MPQVISVELKHGVSKKTGKPWTGFDVTLDDGRKASGFEQVKVGDHVSITQNGKFLNYTLGGATGEKTHNPVQAASVAPSQNSEDGVKLTREHLMRSANLYNLCVDAADKAIAPWMPEVARTSEQFQAIVASLYIEASRRITNDGVNWWSYLDKMPITPIKKSKANDLPF